MARQLLLTILVNVLFVVQGIHVRISSEGSLPRCRYPHNYSPRNPHAHFWLRVPFRK